MQSRSITGHTFIFFSSCVNSYIIPPGSTWQSPVILYLSYIFPYNILLNDPCDADLLYISGKISFFILLYLLVISVSGTKARPYRKIIAWQQFTTFSGSVPAPTTGNYTEGTRAVLLHLPGPGTFDRQQLRIVNNTDNIWTFRINMHAFRIYPCALVWNITSFFLKFASRNDII